MKQYDYLIVGAGLYGAVFAHEAKKAGKKCLVIDKRSHIAGNIYTEPVEGINVHRYGAHIFHTNNKTVWQYVNQFAEFNRYTNSPVANYHGEIYNLPFNMNTFNKMWGVVTPAEATPASSGAAPAPSCRPLSSSVCRCALPTTTTISTPCIRASPTAATPPWWKTCWRAPRCA